jgi:hypothetical protein
MRDELTAIQERIKVVEIAIDHQKQHNVGYHNVGFEIVEAWEALERATDALDEMQMGMT